MKRSTVLYVPSLYPARGKMLFPQHWRPACNGVHHQPISNNFHRLAQFLLEISSFITSQKSQVSSLSSFECRNRVLPSWKWGRFTDNVYYRTVIIIYVSMMVMWYNMTTREKYILLLCSNTKSIQNTHTKITKAKVMAEDLFTIPLGS